MSHWDQEGRLSHLVSLPLNCPPTQPPQYLPVPSFGIAFLPWSTCSPIPASKSLRHSHHPHRESPEVLDAYKGLYFVGYHVSLAFVPPCTWCPTGLPLPCTFQASLLLGFEEASWLAETQGFCYHSATKELQRSPAEKHHFTCIHGDHFCLFGFAFSCIVSFVQIVPRHG